MGRFTYDGNGRLNRDIDVEALLAEPSAATDQLMEAKGSTVSGHAATLDRVYMTSAQAIVEKMRTETLRMRKLSSGLIVYTLERGVIFEPGVEAASLPRDSDVIAFNYENFFEPPEDKTPLTRGHTVWVAQQLIDYDFGVQEQRVRRAQRNY